MLIFFKVQMCKFFCLSTKEIICFSNFDFKHSNDSSLFLFDTEKNVQLVMYRIVWHADLLEL